MNNNNPKHSLVLVSVGASIAANRNRDRITIHPINAKVTASSGRAATPAISAETIRSLRLLFYGLLHALCN